MLHDTIIVTINPNQAPIVDAGADFTIEVQDTVTLHGHARDTDGYIVSYSWEKNGTVLSTNSSFSYTPTVIGNDILTFSATDNLGAISSDDINITVEPRHNLPPTANGGGDRNITIAQTIRVVGTGTDSDGRIVSYQWKQGDTVISNNAYFIFTPTKIGEETFTFQVTDDDNASSFDTIKINSYVPHGHSTIQGVIKEYNSSNSISDVNLTLKSNNIVLENSMSDNNGTYKFMSLSKDINYTIAFHKNDYQEVTYNNIVVDVNRTKNLEVVKLISDNNTLDGEVRGEITHALTGGSLEDVNITVRKNIHTKRGTIIDKTITDSNGKYSLNLTHGIYTLELNKVGFITTYFTVTSIGGETKDNQGASISPVLGNGEVRVVLRWGENPSDLDSHLVKKTNGNENYHIYYGDKIADEDNASLDTDDTSSYGPETITIKNVDYNSIYTYYIYNYSGGGDNVLSNSSANVTLYTNSGEQKFFVPNGNGRYWKVFEIDHGTIIPCSSNCIQGSTSGLIRKMSLETTIFDNLPPKE